MVHADQVSGECMLGPRFPVHEAGSACLYLTPSVLHLTNGDTATLQVMDESGTLADGTLAFFGYDGSLISISPGGLVTALRTEGPSEIGTWVNVTLDGQWVANTCIVRVLSDSVPDNYVTVESENTILNYPQDIRGEYMSGYIAQYEMATINQYSYELQTQLMNTVPFGGCKQIIQVDFGESET